MKYGYAFTSEQPILLATADHWIEMLTQFFQDAGLAVLPAPSYAAARAAIETAPISGIVAAFEWAVDAADQIGIVSLVRNRIPTITLVQRGDGYGRMFDQIYHRPLHEYMVIPLDLEGLYARMEKAGMIKPAI